MRSQCDALTRNVVAALQCVPAANVKPSADVI